MKLHTLGMDYRHDSGFVIDRPNGSGDSLMLIFKTPALLRLNNRVVHATAGSAVVYSPEYHQYYGADGAEYINHWVHFDAEDGDEFLRRIGLPYNTLIPPSDIAAAERVLELLSLESLSDAKGTAESCDLLLRLLLTKLADGMERSKELRIAFAEAEHINPTFCRFVLGALYGMKDGDAEEEGAEQKPFEVNIRVVK